MLDDPPEAVARQLAAYNARDLDAFAACYTDDVVLEDARAGAFVRGLDQLRQRYGALFRDHPENRATVVNRSVALPWVFEAELVERDAVAADGTRTPGKLEVFVVYELRGEKISRGVFFRR